jgi:hypothetical protein
MHYPVTPDGRYFVVRDRLWRCSDPSLTEEARQEYVHELMAARRTVRHAMRARDQTALKQARASVNQAKIALGERGQVWWDDGAPDYTRKIVRNTPYASWYAELSKEK